MDIIAVLVSFLPELGRVALFTGILVGAAWAVRGKLINLFTDNHMAHKLEPFENALKAIALDVHRLAERVSYLEGKINGKNH